MDFEEIPITGKVLSKNIEPLSLKKGGGGSGFEEIPIVNPLKKYEQEETPFMAKHPNLYALKETAKDLPMDVLKAVVPYTKYLDPEERKRFMGLEGVEGGSFWEPKTKVQAQVRELLKENLFSQLLLLPGSRGGKYGLEKAGGWLAKTFPKTAKALTKPRMLSQLQKEEAAIELSRQTPIVQKLNKVLKEAKPIRAEQEKMYTATRAYRMSEVQKVGTKGEAGYYERIGKLKGKMPKNEFESIRNQIGQQDTDALFTQLQGSQRLNEWEKLTAGRGLAKIFGEFGGHVPQERELEFLAKEFGSTFT